MASRFFPRVHGGSSGRGFFDVYDFLAGNYRWIQQESVFWRRGLWERAGGGLDDGLKRAADFDLWLRFLRLAPLYHAGTILGGWRVHENALGDASSGVYSREAEELLVAFAAGYDRRALRRCQ